MASEYEEIEELAEDLVGLFKAGVNVNPTIFLDVAKDFRQQHRSDPNFKLISYQIGTPTTPGHIGELKVAEFLKSQLRNRPDCLVIHSYSNLTPSELDHIEEIDLIILDKLQGLFIMEVKGVLRGPPKSIDRKNDAGQSDNIRIPYCLRASVLLAWRQIHKRLEQIEEVLQRDLMEVGKNYGLLTDSQSESALLNELLDMVELSDRMRRKSFSIHPVENRSESENLNVQCGQPMCYCCHPDEIGIGEINRQTHPHVVVRDGQFEQLKDVIDDRILADLPPIELSDQSLLDNFYLFLLRRFVILRWMFNLPPASKLLKVKKDMDKQMDKYDNDLAKVVVNKETLRGKGVQILTSEQQRLLQRAGRLFITGPAGSGKTVMLILKAKQIIEDSFRRMDSSPNRLLVVFSARGITNYVKEILENHYKEMTRIYANSGVQMPSFEEFALAAVYTDLLDRFPQCFEDAVDLIALHLNCRKFTNILVDESQDIDNYWHNLIELHQSFSRRCFWYFYDDKQTLGVGFVSVLIGCDPVRLTKMFRSTKGIFNLLSAFVDMDGISIPHNVFGQKVTLHDRYQCNTGLRVTDRGYPFKDAAAMVLDVINMMTNEDFKVGRTKVDPKHICQRFDLNDIVVLVQIQVSVLPLIKEINELSKANANDIEAVDTSTPYDQMKPNQIRVESLWNFRGLEGSVVIWFEPDVGWNTDNRYNFDPVFGTKGVFYSAVTRATAHLVLITKPQSEGIRKIFQKCGEKNFTLNKLEKFLLAKQSKTRQSEGKNAEKLLHSEGSG